MDGGERDVRMFAAHAIVNAVGARMIAGFEQCAQHGKTLRRHGHFLAPAVGDELGEPALGVVAASLPAKQFKSSH
jgi:hypothetical protein